MRSVHAKAIHAFMAGDSLRPGPRDRTAKNCQNSEVIHSWFYHESEIARFREGIGVFVNWQDWFTPSTSQRIYSLAGFLGCKKPEKKVGWIKLEFDEAIYAQAIK